MFWFLPELVNALSGLVDVVMALEPVGVACVAVAAAAKAARFCIALRPDRIGKFKFPNRDHQLYRYKAGLNFLNKQRDESKLKIMNEIIM